MTEQYIDLRISDMELRIFFDTEWNNLGQVLMIEGKRISKALETRTPFLENKYRKIINGQSVKCDQHGQASI